MQQLDVVGLGVATLDFIAVAAQEPVLGTKQRAAEWHEAGGGPVATALVTLARLGARTCMLGGVGDDAYGPRIIGDLQGEGVATEGMQIHPGSSHVAFALAEPANGRRTIWWHNDEAVLECVTVDPALVQSARFLLIDSYLPDAALAAAEAMHAAGGLVMIDMGHVREEVMHLLPHCDLYVVSERFGYEATGEEQPERAARALHERYGKLVVVTAGERGSWCVSAGEAFHTPAFSMPIVDTTGAGDVFHGGFLYGLLQGWSLRATARFASATAALKCRAAGGRAGIPTLAEVEALLHATGQA
jgi:ribokinase